MSPCTLYIIVVSTSFGKTMEDDPTLSCPQIILYDKNKHVIYTLKNNHIFWHKSLHDFLISLYPTRLYT